MQIMLHQLEAATSRRNLLEFVLRNFPQLNSERSNRLLNLEGLTHFFFLGTKIQLTIETNRCSKDTP